MARIIIIEVHLQDKKTFGKYKVMKVYGGKEKKYLTKYWHEIVDLKKGKKINNYHDIKVT